MTLFGTHIFPIAGNPHFDAPEVLPRGIARYPGLPRGGRPQHSAPVFGGVSLGGTFIVCLRRDAYGECLCVYLFGWCYRCVKNTTGQRWCLFGVETRARLVHVQRQPGTDLCVLHVLQTRSVVIHHLIR